MESSSEYFEFEGGLPASVMVVRSGVELRFVVRRLYQLPSLTLRYDSAREHLDSLRS